ncbi:MAG: helix-turn-helix transcriptional regulator [Ruminococcaceae bacterium]|nr:helix-turn-helix transcriptional regulator [Oscillospiraceae bacterium]
MENKNLIDKAIGFIQKNPKDNLSLQSIADNAGFSLTYFDAIFRQHTGYSPVEYSRIYKLTRSALELRRTQKTVLEIALDFGYASPESFTRAFKNFYSITPSEYREKYSGEAVTWHDLSGKIAISHFRRSFPELNISDIDLALDFCFTHNPLKYAEDIVGMTVAESEILTLGNPETLEHFIYVSDYNSVEPAVMIICENEEDALPYLRLFAKHANPRFSIRRSVDKEWEIFDAEVAKLGLTCRYGYDMIYPNDSISVPEYGGLSIRLLTAEDMTQVKAFKQNGGCAECHVGAIQICFDGKGNAGMKPMGVFENGELICLAMPTLDQIRELRKYDIGAIFTINTNKEGESIDLMWRYAVDYCLKNNAMIGNSNADEDDSPLGVETCERIGLVKVARNCIYRK